MLLRAVAMGTAWRGLVAVPSGCVPLCHARVCRSLREGASCLGEQSGSLKHFLFTRVVGVSGPFRCPSLQNTLRDLGSPPPPEKKGPRST